MYVDGLREAYSFISRGYHDQTTQAQFTYFQSDSDRLLPESLTTKQTLAGWLLWVGITWYGCNLSISVAVDDG